jgi:hypothetical protein
MLARPGTIYVAPSHVLPAAKIGTLLGELGGEGAAPLQ